MIVLFTDFGLEGPYVGQVKAVLWAEAPAQPVIDLFADAPDRRPREAAYLLAAFAAAFPANSVFLGVVDPGVGGARPGVALRLDGHWFVGPGNGLFELVTRRSAHIETYVIAPAAGPVSASFHGRDVFAPVAGRLAAGRPPAAAGLRPGSVPRFAEWPDDLAAVIYVDRYGNLMTGLRADRVSAERRLAIGGRRLRAANTFSDVARGEAFWYPNANGLVEIAVNDGNAASVFAATIGMPVEIV
jgi:hypothetical protein